MSEVNYMVWDGSYQSVQSLSCGRLTATSWTAAPQASLSITNSRSLVKLMSIELVMASNHLALCHSLLLLPSVFPSIRVFSSESALCIRRAKYWGFSFSISPSNEHSGLISFRIDWFDLLVVQRTLKSLLQNLSSKSSQAAISELWLWLREAKPEMMKPLRGEERRQHVLGQEVVSREEELWSLVMLANLDDLSGCPPGGWMPPSPLLPFSQLLLSSTQREVRAQGPVQCGIQASLPVQREANHKLRPKHPCRLLLALLDPLCRL